jgi:catechol 2,3-dioxygenase-like lactoylglutathione lyase family enzyme
MISHIWAVTLTVSDLERAVRFYEGTLGLSKKYQFGDYAGFECGGVEIGVKTWGSCEPPRRGEPCIDLAVHNLDEAYKTLPSSGVEFLKPPEDAQWGARIAVFRDPDGNTLQLTQVDWSRYFEVARPR